MKIKTLALSVLLAASALAYADDDKMKQDTADKAKPAKLSDEEMKVLGYQQAQNNMNIELAKHVQKHGSGKVTKDLAKMIVADDEKGNREIVAFAKKRGVKVPKDEAVSADSKMAMDQIKKAKGAELDRMYLTIVVAAHDRELEKLDTMDDQVQDPELKRMVEDKKPVVEAHAAKARELQKLQEQTSAIDKDMNKDKDQPYAP